MKSVKHLMLLLPAALIMLISCKDQQVKIYKIEKGSFSQTIVETGELAAIQTRAFLMPRFGRYWSEMKIIGMLDQGTPVDAGDSIIQLDPTDVKKYIIDVEGQLETQEANLEKLIVNQSNSRSEMESTLKNEQATFELRKLEMEFSKFESDKIRKIKELEFEQSKINYNKAMRRIKLNKTMAENDMKIEKIRVEQQRQDLKDAYGVLPQLTIRTPISGIFQIARNRRTGTMVKIGDEIYSNNNMGNVPDLTWMKVNTTVSELDFYKISIGQKVVIRLDAIPDVKFKGEVSDIGKLCYLKDSKSRKKVFDVEVRLLDSDERLKPGMTVSCEFYSKELKEVMYVPISCVESSLSGSFIYLKNGNSFEKTEISTGAANNTHIVIKGDFKPGQEVVTINSIEKE